MKVSAARGTHEQKESNKILRNKSRELMNEKIACPRREQRAVLYCF
jgi:hypothetical protein